MSLRFYFGGSGAGKSTKLYRELIRRSMEEPDRNFLVIVPDQFTMQTQKELVTMHERRGIMNIDVLSFGRLSHRIFEEVGRRDVPVLDDTGKSLVLRKVAGRLQGQLSVLGGNLDKQGYIHEIKSAISEFMQYGISPREVDRLIAFAEKKGALRAKLEDLQVLYGGFEQYIKDKFITTEETLDLLRQTLHQSALIPGSVVVFDGFTGFTPIQNRVIRELMTLAEEVIVTITVDASGLEPGREIWQSRGEQELFYLGRKTAGDLIRMAGESGVPRGQDVYLTGADDENRFAGNSPLSHLEKHLFRYPVQEYRGEQQAIRIYEASDVGEEVRQTGILLEKLVREQGYLYRDIAVICGDLERYSEHVETEFAALGVPCYVDRTRGIVLNPFIEFIKSALALLEKDFSYETVFQYLRCGMAAFDRREVDLLENYVRQRGIRGRKRWENMFVHRVDGMEQDAGRLEQMNGIRERFMEQLQPLLSLGRRESVETYVRALYQFLTGCRAAESLAAYGARFKEEGNLTGAKEYEQIYRLVMELLEQVLGLLGDESMSLEEFREILEAGFGEIQVGTIPQNVDRVLVGDMERTRLKEIKVLFFVGVNDGSIPRNSGKGGIISDMDREFLRQSELELAPSPRQQMYIQRLYLYLNMTKPSQRLYLSYAKVAGDGKSLRPAYLIESLRKMYPGLEIACPEQQDVGGQMLTPLSGMKYLAKGLREYAAGYPVEETEIYTMYHAYREAGEESGEKWLAMLLEAAFCRYRQKPLAREVARALYGQMLQGSVSRLETYAACAYEHFLKYGLQLQERQEYGFEAVDMGNVFHSVLEKFAVHMEESGYTWFNFPEEFGARAVEQAMDAVAAQYGDLVLLGSARNEYAVGRMKRILTRTVLTMQHQLRKGSFTPGSYELSFSSVSDLDSVNIALTEQEQMRLRGRVDRIDTCETEDKVYVKVVDYKSGSRQFDLVALYHGLQLQLVVYMNAALELEKRKHPDKEVVPGAMLYYHVADPVVEEDGVLSPQEINEKLVAQLRAQGAVNAAGEVVDRLDRDLMGRSDVIPVERKKDGELSARSSAYTPEELRDISAYVNQKIRGIGREILEGNIRIRPYENGNREACTYCVYREVCGFDPGIKGYEKNKIGEMSREEALEAIRKEVGQDGDCLYAGAAAGH